jgi:hypothetical protein
MTNRTSVALLAGAAVLALGAALVALLPDPTSRITPKNYQRIQEGMGLADVESILGPPGDYTTGPTYPNYPPPTRLGHKYLFWEKDEGTIRLEFESTMPSRGIGPRDVVVEKVFAPDIMPESMRAISPFDKLLWRGKRTWHRWFPDRCLLVGSM